MDYFVNQTQYTHFLPLPDREVRSISLAPGACVEGLYFARFPQLSKTLEAPKAPPVWSQTDWENKNKAVVPKVAAPVEKPAQPVVVAPPKSVTESKPPVEVPKGKRVTPEGSSG